MARYLNIYLVPKNTKNPVLPLTCYWDCTDEFDAIVKEINVPCPDDKAISWKEKYANLDIDSIKHICEKQESKIKDCDKRIKGLRQSLKFITNKEICKSILIEIDELEYDKDKYQSTLDGLKHLKWFVERIESGTFYEWLYFERIVMNISIS